MRAIFREPTVQFALAACVLFGVSSIRGSGGEVIEIDRELLDLRILQTELSAGMSLDEESRRRIEEAYIDQQVLLREARALGLEEDDRIDDILVQKMLHVLSGEVIQPTEQELEAFYEANQPRYSRPPSYSVHEIVVPPGTPNPQVVPSELAAGEPPEDLVGSVLLSHRVMPALTTEDVTQIFDPSIAAALEAAMPGTWVGPHVTVRGYHWLRVNERIGSAPLPLSEVREQVRLDWVMAREEARLAERVAELRSGYTIRIVGEGEP